MKKLHTYIISYIEIFQWLKILNVKEYTHKSTKSKYAKFYSLKSSESLNF